MLKRILASISLAVSLVLVGGLTASPAQASQHDWGFTVPDSRAPKQTSKDKLLITKKQTLKKAPPVTGPQTLVGTPYWYGGTQQNTSALSPTVQSVGVNFSGWGSTHYLDSTNDAHTLVELAVRKTNNSNVGLVEAGITKDPVLYADAQPRLFVYYWDKFGAPGGYNTNFTLYAGRTYSPGDVLTSNKNIKWVYDSPSNDWWLAVDSTWVGYFEDTAVFPSFTFTTAGQVMTFGEVAQKSGGTRTFSCSDMGVGLDSSNASASSAGSVAFNGAGTNVNMTALAASGSYFTTTVLSARTARYGGAGANSTNTAVGSQGSC